MNEPATLRVTDVRELAAPFVRFRAEVVDGTLDLPGSPDEAILIHFPLPDGTVDLTGRWYTIRRVSPDGREVTVDVVSHAGGVGAEWARHASGRSACGTSLNGVGDELTVSRSACWFRRPDELDWQILVADAAGVPAVARVVEQSPPGLRTEVVVVLSDHDGPPPLPEGTAARVVVTERGTSRLEEIVRGLELPDGPGYLFVVGEASATRAVRRHLRHERGLAPSQYKVVGYWHLDAEVLRERYARNTERFAEAWTAAEAAGGDDEEIQDRYERTLVEAGLIR